MTVQTRIYLPLTAAALRRLDRSGRLEPAPFTAYAVTTDLRREHPTADDEELEYLAFKDAARSGGEPSPVVAAADVDADAVTDLVEPAAAVSAIQVATAVSRPRVAAFHVVLPSSDAVSDGQVPDYAWYDATELSAVLDLLG
ncbi:MAG: hypothetical protein ABJA74_02400 [Lapillicoccus sp.]